MTTTNDAGSTARHRARQYSRIKYKLFFAGMLLGILFLGLYQFVFSVPAARLCRALAPSYYGSIAIYLLIFSAVNYLVTLPLHFYGSFIIEHRFSLSRQSFKNWVKDEVKKTLLSVPIFICVIAGFYAIVRSTGGLWWIFAAVGWFFFTVIFTRIMPTVIIPLFYKYSKLERAELVGKIVDCAGKAGIKELSVFSLDLSSKTKKANAALVGLGGSRRVVLGDTLISNFTDDEIVSVCAHEFAHHVHRHIAKLIAFSCLATGAGFFVLNLFLNLIVTAFHAEAVYDIVIFPVLMIILTLSNLVFMPVQSAYSRKLEREADMSAINLTANPAAFISVMDKLADMNLSDRNPPLFIKWIFYDHPTIDERIAMARSVRPAR